MLRKAVASLCRNSCGLALVGGAISFLTGVEFFFSGGGAQADGLKTHQRKGAKAPPQLQQRLRISQTRSELGYVFWVVREPGGNPAYALFDTWQEAMDEVLRRLELRCINVPRFRAGQVLVTA